MVSSKPRGPWFLVNMVVETQITLAVETRINNNNETNKRKKWQLSLLLVCSTKHFFRVSDAKS